MWIRSAFSACIIVAVAGGGCGQLTDRGPVGRPITISQFAEPQPADGPQPQIAPQAEPPDVDPAQSPLASGVPQTPIAEVDVATDPDPTEDPPTRRVLNVAQPGDRVVVDSLVGEVNGRPIFADDFLEPIEDRLITAAEQMSGPQRDAVFRAIVTSRLQAVIQDALVLAEAEAALTPQQQQGLFALIRSWQEELIRRGGGTRAGIEASLKRETDMTVAQYLDRRKELALVQELRRRKIDPRVIVSWRDIEREYQRRYDEFNPPATVTLARIRLDTESQADVVEQVTQRFAKGDSFAQIAEELGFVNGGVWDTFEMGEGGISEIDVSDAIKTALAGLSAGDTSEPFAQGPATVWLHVVSVDRSPAQGLYDRQVQRGLANEIRLRRNQEEWQRYINSLLKRGIYDELDDMGERLYRIALLRYGR